MRFENVAVKGARADLAKGVILLTFAVSMRDQEAAEQVAEYIGKSGGDVELIVQPRQFNFAEMRTWKTESVPGTAVAGGAIRGAKNTTPDETVNVDGVSELSEEDKRFVDKVLYDGEADEND